MCSYTFREHLITIWHLLEKCEINKEEKKIIISPAPFERRYQPAILIRKQHSAEEYQTEVRHGRNTTIGSKLSKII